MASITPNLKLVLEDGLTSTARSNLLKLDALGQVYNVSPTSTVQIRSASNIELLPNAASVGGTGTGGSVSFGRAGQPLSGFNIFTESFGTDGVDLRDQTSGSDAELSLVFESDNEFNTGTYRLNLNITGITPATLSLGGDLFTTGGNLTLTLTGDSDVTLPEAGTLLTDTSTASLTNKTFPSLVLESGAETLTLTAPALGASYSFSLPPSLGTDGQILARSGAGGTAWIDMPNIEGVGEELTSLWTPALGGTVNVTHSIGTRQLLVEVLDTAANYATIEVEVERPDDNTLRLISNIAPPNNWLIVIKEIL